MGPPRTTTRFQLNAEPLASGKRTVSNLCQINPLPRAESRQSCGLRRLCCSARKLHRDDAVEIGKGTPTLVETKAVAREQLVGNGEADVAKRDVVDEAAIGSVEEGDGREARRISERERPAEEVERQASVYDVLHEYDVTTGERRVDVLQQANAAGAAASIRREFHDVERVGDRQCSRQIGEEDDARLEGRDEDRIESRVVAGELGSELENAGRDLGPAQIDRPDGALFRWGLGSRHDYDARRSR
jgi:hypothetical protein